MNPTPNQRLLLSGILSLVVSAASTALTAASQVAVTHGTLTPSVLIVVALTTFGGTFGTALYNFIPAHLPEELAAIKDMIAELQGAISAPVPTGTMRMPTVVKTNTPPLLPSPLELPPSNIFRNPSAPPTPPPPTPGAHP